MTIIDSKELENLLKFENDKKVLENLRKIKRIKKVQLADYISRVNGVNVDPDSIFDIQVKRLHEYKRQMLNVLKILYLYFDNNFDFFGYDYS